MFGLLKIIRKWQQRRETDAFRRVAEELHKSALFSRAILDSINDHIVILDVNTFEIVDANSTFMRVMGKPFDELVGKPCYAAIHGRSEICTGPEQTCPLLEMRETGQYASAEHIRYRNGIKKIAEVSASPIRDEQGTIVQVVHVAHDITARKQAEEALRESEARYRDLFENANDLIQSVRFSDGSFLYVNRAWREAMGYSEEEMAHLKMFDVISPDCGAHCQETFGRVRQGERIDNVEAVFIAKNGRKIIVEGSVNCSFVDGKPFATRGIFRDITERKQDHEKLLRYADEVQEANEEVRNFSYIVSHDLRAPLVSIKGFSAELKGSLDQLKELMAETLPTMDHAKQQQVEAILTQDVGEALGFIGSSVARMDGQINAILNLSRLGRREMKIEEVVTAPLVTTILDSLAHQIEARKVRLEVGELPTIRADRTALEQIFGNLIDNALKYLSPGREGEIAIWSEEKSGVVLFHVRDNGRGIAEEDQHKVFDLFRRAGTQDTPGEGMGLPYVKTLVKRHGGRIWLTSELGVGSTFSFSMPLMS